VPGRERITPLLHLPPGGCHPRGFTGKNSFADAFNLLSGRAATVFDVGANAGETAAEFRKLWPHASIHCFEPYPRIYDSLVDRFIGDCRVRCLPFAVGAVSGAASLHTFENDVCNSLSPFSATAGRYIEGSMTSLGTVPVQLVTLDDYSAKNGIESIDLLKIDVQGGEVDVLSGSHLLLEDRRIRLVYAEVLFVDIYEGQSWFWDVAAFLHGKGYEMYDFYNFAYSEDGQLKWGDAIFLPA